MTLRDIASRHGGYVYAGGTRALVPGPGHSKGDRSVSLLQVGDRVVVHSFAGDSHEDVLAYLGLANGSPLTPPERRRAQAEREAQQRASHDRAWRFCGDVWAATLPVVNTPAERYLASRAVAYPAADLRYHRAAPTSYDGRSCSPALVALARAPDGSPTAIQSTFIRRDGAGKAFGGASRLTFGPLSGGAVRLTEPRDGILAIAEGVETALSFTLLFGIPCWAALGTSGLVNFDPPRGLRRLYVAGDPGEGGVEAARRLGQRLSGQFEVVVSRPADGPGDWNDTLRRKVR